jgi:hypothetical protein
MSDPLKSTDIEDVLSSIRRLVSEETGERPAKGDAAPGNSRLVLTPALRVNEPGPDEDNARGRDQDDFAGDPPAHTDGGAADDHPDVTIPAQPEAGDAPETADADEGHPFVLAPIRLLARLAAEGKREARRQAAIGLVEL